MTSEDSVVLGDRYRLGDVLGRGGMADVYRATDELLGREVAVKVLRETAGDESDRRRFTAEARTLAGLSNTGLVMVLDAGITSEQPFLVMELVDGPTLGQLCAKGPVAPERVGSIGVQVAEALAYAHARGVVHRDVKPGNVLLGPQNRVKLADFGIARLIGDTVRHTKTGHSVGTAAYLAPEQVRGDDVGPAADVYSLGLVLLEALTGERAYPGAAMEAALARLSRGPEIPATLPEVWRSLLGEMTALDPAQRPAAGEVAALLRTQPTGPLPAPPPPPPVIDRAGDALARQPREVAARLSAMPPHLRGVAAAVAALVLLMVIVGIAAGPTSGSDQDLPERTPPELEQPLQELHDAVNEG